MEYWPEEAELRGRRDGAAKQTVWRLLSREAVLAGAPIGLSCPRGIKD